VKNYPNNTLIWEKEDKEFKGHSYKEIQEEVYTYANGLLSLGINNGDRLALLSEEDVCG